MIKQIPNLFTLLNLIAGCIAIIFILQTGEMLVTQTEEGAWVPQLPEKIWWGSFMIGIAAIVDFLDGFIARLFRATSAMGGQLDSLADVISFGVAPAALGFGAGLDGFWDCLVLAYFVACGVSRLARYNITAEALAADASGKVKYFEGTPIPTSVVLVGVMAFAAWQGRIGADVYGGHWILGGLQLHPLVLLYLLSGSLMISKTLRIPKL